MSEGLENKKQEEQNTTSTEKEELNQKADQKNESSAGEAEPEESIVPNTEQSSGTEQKLGDEEEEATRPEEEVGNLPVASEATQDHEVHEVAASSVNSQDVSAQQPSPSEDHDDNNQPDDTIEEDQHQDENHIDYSTFDREQLVMAIEDQLKNDDIRQADRQANEIKHYFDELVEAERKQALDHFKKQGGEEDDFDFKSDELTDRFFQAYRLIKERKSNFYQKLNQDLNQNYEAKLDVLNRIRDFVDSEETQVSINKLKELQTEWRSIGRVPHQHNRNLWANYNALINRFYDNRSIYFELKELDRKKNMEAKLELCEKAEALADDEDIKKVLRELDELHEEYKHIGPVPKEEQEALWLRFKTASDRIHDRRREYVDQFKEELNENLQKKEQLCEEVNAFANFQSDSIKEWNKKTKEIQDLQKRWESVGAMPREKAKEVNKKFWSSFKQFFAHKGEFFKHLDAQREENLKKKEVLLEKAEQLKESTDWQKTANELKRLQREWKEIGPVPEKQREEVYRKFKSACDAFFERKRESNKEQESAYQQNLEAKEAVCEQIEKLAASDATDTEKLQELSEEFASIGFVPRNAIKKISQRYEKALESFMRQAKGLDEQQKDDLKLELEVTTMRGTPRAERKLDNKESSLRKKIGRLEEDISLWKNNISFFAQSKQADKLKQEYEQKIDEASAELEHLKSQLNLIENMR